MAAMLLADRIEDLGERIAARVGDWRHMDEIRRIAAKVRVLEARAEPCAHVYETTQGMTCMFCGHELGTRCDGCGEWDDACRCEEIDRKIRYRLEQERDA